MITPSIGDIVEQSNFFLRRPNVWQQITLLIMNDRERLCLGVGTTFSRRNPSASSSRKDFN